MSSIEKRFYMVIILIAITIGCTRIYKSRSFIGMHGDDNRLNDRPDKNQDSKGTIVTLSLVKGRNSRFTCINKMK